VLYESPFLFFLVAMVYGYFAITALAPGYLSRFPHFPGSFLRHGVAPCAPCEPGFVNSLQTNGLVAVLPKAL
jgi:hypothetical protein